MDWRLFYVYVNLVMLAFVVKRTSMSVHPVHVKMVEPVWMASLAMYVNV